MSPAPEQNPQHDPDDNPLARGYLSKDNALRLEAGFGELTRLFDRFCAERDLTAVSRAATHSLERAATRLISNIISLHPEWRPTVESSLYLRTLAVAEGGNEYFILGALTDRAGHKSFLFDFPNGIAPLQPGNAAAFVYGFDRRIIEGSSPRLSPAERIVSFRALIEPGAFNREVEAFTENNSRGVIAALLEQRLTARGRGKETIQRVEGALPISPERNTTAFITSFHSSSALIDIYHDTTNGGFHLGPLRFLTPGERPPQDYCFDERSAGDIRKDIVRDFHEQRFFPVKDSPWLDGVRGIFREALCGFFTPPDPTIPLSIEPGQVFGQKLREGFKPIVIEASIRDDKNSFILPGSHGEPALRCIEPISLFYAMSLVNTANEKNQLTFRLSHLALPPCGGVEGVIAAMMKAPASSILNEPLIAVLAADMKLSRQEVTELRLTRIIPLEADEDNEQIELTPENASDPREPVLFLCAHSRGTHLIGVNRSSSGLIDIIDDIVPLYFFPNLSPR